MQLLRYLCPVLLIAGCEHKSQRDDQGAAPADPTGQPSPDPSPAARAAASRITGSAADATANGSGTGSGTGSGSAVIEAAGTDANVATTAGDMTVRPPVASDLAEYVTQLHGKGTKLAATIDTSLGTIHCELFGDKAPLAVANFVGLATGQKAFKSSSGTPVKKKFFDGLTFHRVIPTFMIQGGDPEGSGRGGPGYEFKNEVAGLKMGPGALAMANAGPDTNGSQFFIMEGDHPDLETGYTNFGQCKEVDVVTKITHTPTTPGDKPVTPVLIKSVKIELH
jgi:peptidyl-prolyl cis-trans isomerase A (cyclophilin A)